MKINRIALKNFKKYESFALDLHPQFTLLVGENGSGKTTILDALAVAAGSWFLGIRGYNSRNIRPDDIRLVIQQFGDTFRKECQFPVEVKSFGVVQGGKIEWVRTRNSEDSNTNWKDAKKLQDIARNISNEVMHGNPISLPLISYYGTGRLWQEPKDMRKRPDELTEDNGGPLILRETSDGKGYMAKALQDFASYAEDDEEGIFDSRFAGYRYSIDPRCNPRDLIAWMRAEKRIAVDEGKETTQFSVVKTAIKQCLEGCISIDYNLKLKALAVEIEGVGIQPFSNLSDGQRNLVALVGDIAFKAAQLNPHLGEFVLEKTPGVVLIDELDLHLHPKWQRRVAQDLKTVFKSIQFICTTHSPQVIGEVQPDEIRLLNDNGYTVPDQAYGMDSNRVLEEIMEAPTRNAETDEMLGKLSTLIDQEKFTDAQDLIHQLEEKLHDPEDPALTHARSLISLLESTK